MEALRTFLAGEGQLNSGLLWMAAFFIGLETLVPRAGAKVTTAARIRAIGFWVVYNAAILLLFNLISPVWTSLGVKPLLPNLAPLGAPRLVGVVIGCIAAAYIGDFFYYWGHRFEHRFLWRFHAMHHSVREMSGITAYHHVSEQIFNFLLYTIPLSLLTRDPLGMPILGWMLALQGNYLHSPTWLNFGPLGRYFIDNRFHRIHHSVEQRHFDKNFGLFTTLWDVVFGTAYFPAKDEWPETGVADYPEPTNLRQFVLAPFTYRKRAAPAASDALTPERA